MPKSWRSIKGIFINSFYSIYVLIVGYFLFKEILTFITNIDKNRNKNESLVSNLKTERKLFLITFITITIVNCLILFTCAYPGDLTPDSISQVTQLTTGTYSNHHPYYHTQIIKLLFDLGMTIFNDINAAVATYSVFSIVVMALSFSYVVTTIYKCSNNLKISIVVALWYLAMPFHMHYSYTMWKDIFFGATTTIFAVSIYRILKNIGKTIPNYIVMTISAIGMCLLRSNGYFAFVFSTLIFFILFKKEKKLIIIFICVLISTFILKHPVLNALNVTQPDTIESLSVPAQQIARVVVDDKELTNKQEKLLSKVVDIDLIKENYSSYISDPIKGLVRKTNNQDYIKEHKIEFIKLWIELGLKYPQTYVKAWIDETRGYWNGGYNYWRWADGVYENTLGIERTVNNQTLRDLYSKYCSYYSEPGIRIFLCIGFYFWLSVISLWKSIKLKDKAAAFATIPFLMVILSLCVATPVYAEFRYAYALFCGMPFIMMVSSIYLIKSSK